MFAYLSDQPCTLPLPPSPSVAKRVRSIMCQLTFSLCFRTGITNILFLCVANDVIIVSFVVVTWVDVYVWYTLTECILIENEVRSEISSQSCILHLCGSKRLPSKRHFPLLMLRPLLKAFSNIAPITGITMMWSFLESKMNYQSVSVL